MEDYSEDIPLCVTKRVILSNQHGKAPCRRPSTAKQEHSLEHVYTKKRFHVQKGKTLFCPAELFIRHVKRYDTFSVKGDASRARKEDAMKRLKQELAQTNPPTSTFIHVKIPLVEAHQNHTINSGRCYSRQRIKSAKLAFREELKKLTGDSYLCEDLETFERSTEVLMNLRKSFVTVQERKWPRAK